jgi:hypothetical protein
MNERAAADSTGHVSLQPQRQVVYQTCEAERANVVQIGAANAVVALAAAKVVYVCNLNHNRIIARACHPTNHHVYNDLALGM